MSVSIRVYQIMTKIGPILPFFCRRWVGMSHPLRPQLPSPMAGWASGQYLQIGRVSDDQGHVVSTSHKETARTGQGDHRSLGPRGVFESRRCEGDDAPP